MRIASALSLLAIVLAASPASAAWLPEGSPVCTAPGFQGQLLALPIPGGDLATWRSMFLVWGDARDTVPAGMDQWFELVGPLGPEDTDGSPGVVAPGFQGYAQAAVIGATPETPPGASGGVVVAWADDRNGPLDIYARRIGDWGAGEWPAGGVPVCVAASVQHEVQVTGGENGMSTIAWLDGRSGTFDGVYAQRLDAAGVPQWASDGVAVTVLPVTRSTLKIAPAPGGDVFLAWTDARHGDSRVFLVRWDAAGALEAGWPADGLEITSQSFSALERLTPDGAGGLYVTFWGGGLPFVTRIDGDGQRHSGWPAEGVPLGTSYLIGSLPDVVRFEDGIVAVWSEDADGQWKTTDYDVRAQRVLGDGTRPAGWPPAGNVVCSASGSQFEPRVAEGPAIVVVWEDERAPLESPDLYAMRLRPNGSPDPDWPANGVRLAGGNGRQYSPRPVWDGIAGVMVGYLDDHDFDLGESDVYAQIVNFSGTVDVPRPVARGISLAVPVPNPARSAVSFALTTPPGTTVRADVVDAPGRRVRVLDAAAGTLRWDLRDDAGRPVEPGVYFVRVRGRGGEASRAVVVRR